jgi:hypothetical protein
MFLLAVGLISLLIAFATIALALRLPARSSILSVVACLAVVGGIAGVYCSFNVRWQPSPTIRYLGFPFPAMLWRLENGQWVDYVGGPITAVMNVAWFFAVSTLPVFAWLVFQRPWRSSNKRT